MGIVLHQFEFSHFNDKARWALAFKGIEHARKSYLPGPHRPQLRRLSGQPQTPVLEIDGTVIAGSAAIIERLERDHPQPALYPEDAEERAAALALQANFDEEVGPATRTALFSCMIDERAYLCTMFAKSASPAARLMYRATLPLARRLIAKGNGVVDPKNVERAFSLVEATLDEVAQRVADTGYLVGDHFTVADLSAAALLAPITDPPHPDMQRPRPMPQSIADLIENYAEHPAIAWVQRMYREHR